MGDESTSNAGGNPGEVAVAMMPSAARAAGEAPELELEPCTTELVDGREVEGRLAVQFDMREHLIVYAPRLATVRSFLKQHVHAVTVEEARRITHDLRTDACQSIASAVGVAPV